MFNEAEVCFTPFLQMNNLKKILQMMVDYYNEVNDELIFGLIQMLT